MSPSKKGFFSKDAAGGSAKNVSQAAESETACSSGIKFKS